MNFTWTEDKMDSTGSWPRWVCRDASDTIVGFVEAPNGIHWSAFKGLKAIADNRVDTTSYGSREQAQTALEFALVAPPKPTSEALYQEPGTPSPVPMLDLGAWMATGNHQTCEVPNGSH